MPYKNAEDKKRNDAEYLKKNRDKRRSYLREYFKKNHERLQAENVAYAKAHPEKVREYQRRAHLKKYDLTEEQYRALEEKQGGKCACCGVKPEKRLRVDHDHVTGAIRGLLCHNCNVGIGHLGDCLEGVLMALVYLRSGNLSAQEPVPE